MTNDERAIRELVQTWMTASKAGDIQTVLSLMTDDVVFMTPDSPTPVHRSGYTLTILRKESDGRWRIACDANLLTTREN